mmetsp:Transcript_63683/g.126003  ORF Transcript_63683/g.126003 Transcript_63683/m.126003 type:complete len:136 (+) Transcript_63683:175-582(+)
MKGSFRIDASGLLRREQPATGNRRHSIHEVSKLAPIKGSSMGEHGPNAEEAEQALVTLFGKSDESWNWASTSPQPKDCQFGPWQDWYDCSASCGGGTRFRERDAASDAVAGGRPCGRAREHDEQDCAPKTCATKL